MLNNIALIDYRYNNYNILRLWKTNVLFNKPLEKINYSQNYIGSLNYTIYKDNINIHFIHGINNDKYKLLNLNDYNLTNNNYVQTELLNITELKAKKNNIKKINIYINSLPRFYKDFYDYGFTLSDELVDNNLIKIEKTIY